MELTPSGAMIHQSIPQCEAQFGTVTIDSFVVMPNHVHVLIAIAVRVEDEPDQTALSDVVKWLKNTTVRRFGIGVRNDGWKPYQDRLWQKGYHDHIVRNEKDLDILRAYIANNVASWQKDTFHDGFIDPPS